MLEGFQRATEPLEKMEGFSKAEFLLDRINNKAISITMWESEEALVSSAAQADEIRKSATETSGAPHVVLTRGGAMTVRSPETSTSTSRASSLAP